MSNIVAFFAVAVVVVVDVDVAVVAVAVSFGVVAVITVGDGHSGGAFIDFNDHLMLFCRPVPPMHLQL